MKKTFYLKRLSLFFIASSFLILNAAAIQQTGPGTLKSSQFESPLICSGCHIDIYAQWNGSLHSLSDRDEFYLLFFKDASEGTNGSVDLFCARCHTPVGVVAGEIPPSDGSKLSEIAKKGISCDFCHTIIEGDVGNAQFVSSTGNIKRGPFKDSVSPYHETQYFEYVTKSEFCGMCHNVNHPVNNIPLEEPYTEWKESAYAEDGVQCQDCHMTPGITRFQNNPGRASTSGTERENIFIHNMEGGNGFIGSEEMIEKAQKRLEAAAKVELIPPEKIISGQEAAVAVKVSNIGAGHKLPAGITEIREMWLQVTAKDAKGRELFSSGTLDSSGNINKDSVVYKTVVVDKEGKPTYKFWLAEKKTYDYRIPPKGSVTENYRFMVPEDAVLPVQIEAKLLYRTAPQSLIDSLYGDRTFKVPVIEMAKDNKKIGPGGVVTEPEGKPVPGFGSFQLVWLLMCAYIVRRNHK